MANKPDFIVDPDGRVYDVRSKNRGTPPPVRKPNSGYTKTPSGPGYPPTGNSDPYYSAYPSEPYKAPKAQVKPSFIIIPIGLIITVIFVIIQAVSPHHRTTYTWNYGSNRSSLFSSANSDFSLGMTMLHAGEFKLAITSFSLAIQANPFFGEAYNNRGLAHSYLDEYEQAFADFQKAVELMPASARAYNNRGAIFLQRNETEKAFSDFNTAISREPGLAKAYFNRGIAYLSQKNYDQAIADFDQAIKYTPESSVKMPGVRQLTADPLLPYDLYYDTYANLPVAYTLRGEAYLSQGDTDQAFQDMDKAVLLQPDCAMAYYYRGLAYETTWSLDQAIADFQKVLELNNDPEYVQKAGEQLRLLNPDWNGGVNG